MSKITPTVGRKLYFYPNGDTAVKQLDPQPVDATVLYVHPDSGIASDYLLNLLVVDHIGNAAFKSKVRLVQDGDADPTVGFYARWMPYQVGQAAKQAAESESAPAAPEAAAEAPTGEAAGAGVTPETPQSSLASLPPDTSHSAQSTPGDGKVPGTTDLDFGAILKFIKAGGKAARAGWNGTGQYIFLVPGSKFTVNRAPLLGLLAAGTEVNYRPHIDLMTADGSVGTWAPSNSDALAEDWYVIF